MSTLKAKHFHLIDDLDISALAYALIERVETAVTPIGNMIRTWARRSNDRRILAQMNDHLLDDIGLSRGEVARESAKYFWQN